MGWDAPQATGWGAPWTANPRSRTGGARCGAPRLAPRRATGGLPRSRPVGGTALRRGLCKEGWTAVSVRTRLRRGARNRLCRPGMDARRAHRHRRDDDLPGDHAWWDRFGCDRGPGYRGRRAAGTCGPDAAAPGRGLRRLAPREVVVVRGPEALVCPRPYGCSPLAPCPPSPGPRSDGPTPGSYAAQCPVPMLVVLGSSVNMGTRTPTVLPRHRPGTWPLKPIRDASMF